MAHATSYVHDQMIIDYDDHFRISDITRKIEAATATANIVVQGDHNSERYTFEVRRFVEGHDMSLSDSIRIHYANGGKNGYVSADIYEVKDAKVVTNSDGIECLIFSWLISGNATKYDGIVEFAVEFVCYDSDISDFITYSWHTDIYNKVTVRKGMLNQEVLVDEFRDVLESWRQELFTAPVNLKEQLLNEIENKGREVNDSIPDSYQEFQNEQNDKLNKFIMSVEDESEIEDLPDVTKIVIRPDGTFKMPEEMDIENKVDKLQGVENAGRTLVINNEGNVVCGKVSDGVRNTILDIEWEQGGISDSTGEKVNSSKVIRATEKIELIPGNKLVFTGDTFVMHGDTPVKTNAFAYFYDENKEIIARHNGATGGYIIPDNAKYVWFTYGLISTYNVNVSQVGGIEEFQKHWSVTVKNTYETDMDALMEKEIPSAYGNILAVAETYLNRAYQNGDLVYNSEKGPLNPEVLTADGKYGIMCSGFVGVLLKGIKFEESRYVRQSNIEATWGFVSDGTGHYKYDKTEHPYSYDYMTALRLMEYCRDHGELRKLDWDDPYMCAIHPGEFVFSGDITDAEQVDHIAYVLNVGRYTKSDGTIKTTLSVLDSYPHTDHSGKAVGIRIHKFSSDLNERKRYKYVGRFPIENAPYTAKIIVSEKIRPDEFKPAIIFSGDKKLGYGLYTVVLKGNPRADKNPYITLNHDDIGEVKYYLCTGNNESELTFYAEKPFTWSVGCDGEAYDFTDVLLYRGARPYSSDRLYNGYEAIDKKIDGLGQDLEDTESRLSESIDEIENDLKNIGVLNFNFAVGTWIGNEQVNIGDTITFFAKSSESETIRGCVAYGMYGEKANDGYDTLIVADFGKINTLVTNRPYHHIQVAPTPYQGNTTYKYTFGLLISENKSFVYGELPSKIQEAKETAKSALLDASKCEYLQGIKIDFNTNNKTVKIDGLTSEFSAIIFACDFYALPVRDNPEIKSEIDWSDITELPGTKTFVYDTINKKFAFRHIDTVRKMQKSDICLFTVYLTSAGTVMNDVFIPYCNNIYLNGQSVHSPASMIGEESLKVAGNHFVSNKNTNVVDFRNIVTGKTYTVFAFNCNGFDKGYPYVYRFRKDGTYDDMVKYRKDCSIGYYWEMETFEDTAYIRIYASKNAAYDEVSCDWAIYEQKATLSGLLQSRVQTIENIQSEYSIKSFFNRTTCNIFKRVVCCGDSYTSVHIQLIGGPMDGTNEQFAWPHYMSTLTGNEWINCGCSGCNVLTWQTHERGLPTAREKGKVQAYVIGLMINDVSESDRAVPLGTVSDIGTDAQTYYGGMSAIIRKLNAISPNAKIFVNTCPKTSAKYTQYNQAVRNIVDAYKATYPVHCIDLEAAKDYYTNSSLTDDYVSGHYTAIGYEQFAEIYSYVLSDYINHHVSEFQNVHKIEYDS